MSTLKNNQLEAIGLGMIAPTPTISITDPILFNTCLAATADEDDIRFYLCYLSIDPIKKTITGCSGISIVSGEALDFSSWKSKEKLLILPTKKLPKGVLNATINIKDKLITGIAKKGHFTIPFLTSDEKYPSHSLIATEENKINPESICLNPKLLKNLQKASLSVCAKITTHQPKEDCYFYSIKLLGGKISGQYTAIIMPCRA